MRTLKRLLLCSVILCFDFVAKAQTSDSVSAKDKIQFKLGIFYNSRLNYYGRTDSLQSSGYFPIAELWFNKNLYVNAAPVLTNNSINGFEYGGSVITAGYQAKSKSGKFITHLFFTKPVYKSSSKLVQSALKGQMNMNLSWQNQFLSVTGGADLKFSNKTDCGLNVGVDHIFRYELPSQFVLVVNPSAYVYAGTQQFTKTYYTQHHFFFLPGTEQAVTKEVSRLSILSYELSAPVILAKNRWQMIMIPAYVIPENVLSTVNNKSGYKNLFYITAGIKRVF